MHAHAERKRAYCLGMLARAAVSAAAAACTEAKARRRRRRLRTEPPRPGGGSRAREGREGRGTWGRQGGRARARARGRGRARLARGGAGRAPAGARPAGAAVRCGARARAREPARPGAGQGRHAPRAATCLRLGGRPADCKARPRGEGGCEETGASAFLEGRLPPRRPRGGRAGGARGPPALAPQPSRPAGSHESLQAAAAGAGEVGATKRVERRWPHRWPTLASTPPAKRPVSGAHPDSAQTAGAPWF